MKKFLPIALLCVPACTVFGGLTESELSQMNEHRIRCEKYFNAHRFGKAIDQAKRGLAIDPDDYALHSRLAWSYLELSSRVQANNVVNLSLARRIFAKIIDWRDIDEHDSRTIFGYAKSLHNQARVDQLEAQLLLAQSKMLGAQNSGKATESKAFTLSAQRYESLAERYFLILAEGDVAGRANRREAYEYLMVLKYRAKNFDKAIEYGNTNLKLNEAEVKFWKEEYERTKLPGYEALARDEIQRLGKSATAVHSSLAKYYRQNKKYAEAIVHLDAVIAARPRSYQEFFRRGTCYRLKAEVNDQEKARKDFQAFLQMSDLPETNEHVRDAYEYVYGKGK